MVKRNTWVLLALFAVLAGFALFLKYKPASEPVEADVTPSATLAPVEFLLPTDQGDITSLLIESREGGVVGLELKDNVWVLTKPFDAAATQTSLQDAVSQLTSFTAISRVEVDPTVVGLKSPVYTITVGFSSGKSVITQIGDITPTESGYYVRKEDGSILVVDKYGIESLLELFTYPPYVETPTPSPLPPTETLTPSPTSTPFVETPVVTKTP
jgi:hypothetical protein